MNEQAVMTPGQRGALHNVARDLHHKFEGVFGIETIEALVLDSFDELSKTASVTRWLVVGAERFAEQRLKAFIHAEQQSAKVPGVLFLCVHNAGRSQMALGWFSHLAGSRAVAWSGGSEPGAEINQVVVAAMAEVGIDISSEFPKPWTDEFFGAADVVVTMGCGDAVPAGAREALRGLGARGSDRQNPRGDPADTRRGPSAGSTHSSPSSSRRPAMMVGNEECRNQSYASVRLASSAGNPSRMARPPPL